MTENPSRPLASAWVVFFFFLVLRYSSGTLPPPALAYGVAVAGWLLMLLAARAEFFEFVRSGAWLLGAAAVLAVCVLLAQLGAQLPEALPGEHIPAQPALLLCLAPLAFMLARDARLRRAVGWLACLFAAWHAIDLPFEAITGIRIGWNIAELHPRDAGPIRFQAAGLAHQTFYFPGFFLPLYYVAWGFLYARFGQPDSRRRRVAFAVLALAWLLPVASVQSRSALFGTALAGALLAVTVLRPRRIGATGLAVIAFGLLVAGVYAVMFSENKSGAGLRWLYAQLYVRESLHWPQFVTGHGFSVRPPPWMFVAPNPPSHSHNDLIQVLYSWGAASLLAYLVFLGSLFVLVWRNFARQGTWWPAAALTALLPNMVTDLGIHHYEKASFLVLLVALCLAGFGKVKDATGEVSGSPP